MNIDVNGSRVFAHTGGRNFDPSIPALILIHGAGNDHTFWGMQTRYFAHHGYSVLALDLPGHGRSGGKPLSSITDMSSWLWQVIECLRPSQINLAGHSMGSLIALEAAAMHPDKTKSLILAGAAERVAVHKDLLEASLKNDPSSYDMITDWGFSKWSHLGGHQVPGLWMQGGSKALLASGSTGVLGCDLVACNEYAQAIEAAKKIICPSLIIIGSKDRMTPPAMAENLIKNLVNVEIQSIESTGHMIIVERINEAIDIIADFLKQVA
ncbi:MAG: alpha/beta hydrolase [Rhodospirillales bacterium]|nr:alpha/beta hydrolase [Rhodospirillales bacterium]